MDQYNKRGAESAQFPSLSSTLISPALKPVSDGGEQPVTKTETPLPKLEEQKSLFAKHTEYLEKLKLENQKLKEDLRIEKQKSEFLESQIELENKPLGYNFSRLGLTKASTLPTQASKASPPDCTLN